MLYISMDTCPSMSWSYEHWVVFFSIETLFFIDLVLWFFTVQNGTKKPYSLKKTSKMSTKKKGFMTTLRKIYSQKIANDSGILLAFTKPN